MVVDMERSKKTALHPENGKTKIKVCVNMTVSRKSVALMAVGALITTIGVILIPTVDHIVTEQIKKKVILSNTSELYDVWQDVPVPVYMQFYFFNVCNVQEILSGEKPYVDQHGPYTYRERRIKFDIVWNSNGTVTYRQNRTFTFIPEMSVGNDTDMITTLNPLIATLAQGFQWFPTTIKRLISMALGMVTDQVLFISRPVAELLWGYDDPPLIQLNRYLPSLFPLSRIGYFIQKNYTDDGLYTVVTGEKDIGRLGTISHFNGKSTIDIWTTKWAGMVNGTDGSLYSPFAFEEEVLEAFIPDICRSVRAIYEGDVYTPQAIAVRRYSGNVYDMLNATANPDNIGFCTPENNCLPSGLLNGAECQKYVHGFDVPVIFSFPHFLYSEPEVVNSIYGMQPNTEEHGSYIDIEPWTGLVLQVVRRMQVNMFVEKVDSISQTENIRTMYFPIYWLNESSVTDDKHANMLIDQLFTPLFIINIVEIVLICLGSLLVVTGAALCLRTICLVRRQHLNQHLNRQQHLNNGADTSRGMPEFYHTLISLTVEYQEM